MSVVSLDRATGRTSIAPLTFTLDATLIDIGDVTLRIPTVSEWCHMVDLHAVCDPVSGDPGQLAVNVLRLLGYPGPMDAAVWPMWIDDPTLLGDLLCHWRDWPITAFRTDPTAPERPPDVQWQHLSPGRRTQIDLYQALRPQYAPEQVDRMELWQVASLCVPMLDEPDRPDRPAVESNRWEKRDTYVDKKGVRRTKGVQWRRNPDAPMRYGEAAPQPMPVKIPRPPSPEGQSRIVGVDRVVEQQPRRRVTRARRRVTRDQ